MLSPRHVTRQHVCGSEKTRQREPEQDSEPGYYNSTRGLSRVPVWYMMRRSLGEKNVRMTTGNCVLVNWGGIDVNIIIQTVLTCDSLKI